MLLRCTLAATAAVLALSSSPARAEERWYGYQVGACDVAGWGLIVGGSYARSWPVAAVGFGAILLGGPIVHTVHENYGRGGISLGMRVGAPLLGIAIGSALDKRSRSIVPGGAILGAFLGYVAAAATDIAFVAREEVPETAPRMFSIGGSF